MTTSRTARTRAATPLLVLLAAALLTAACAPAAPAAVIGSSPRGLEGGPALAADGRVVVGERRGNGALRVQAIDPRTRVITTVASLGPLADPKTFPELSLAGTGGIVTASLNRYGQSQNELAQPVPPLLAQRTATILPTFAQIASCGGGSALASIPTLDAAAGDSFIASVGEEGAGRSPVVRLRSAGATIAVPAVPGPAGTLEPQIFGLRATGPMVAWSESVRSASGPSTTTTIVVARGATGEVLLRGPKPFGAGLALGADGTVVTTADAVGCNLAVLSAALPAGRVQPLPPGLCATGLGSAIVGGRMVYRSGQGFAITDLQGNAHALDPEAREPSTKIAPIAFDGRTAYVVRSDCTADRLLAVDTYAVGPPPPPLTSSVEEFCPVKRSGSSRLRVRSDGRARFVLSCRDGCHGRLRIVQQRGRLARLVGKADYSVGPGRVVVKPKIAKFARALAGCKGGVRVIALSQPAGTDDYKQAGEGTGIRVSPYRLSSNSRCRRSGPKFTTPKEGPRP